MFGSATCDYSAELCQKFGVTCGLSFTAFCFRCSSSLEVTVLTNSYESVSYQLMQFNATVSNFQYKYFIQRFLILPRVLIIL